MKLSLSLLFIFFVSVSTFAQTKIEKLYNQLDERGEVYISFSIKDFNKNKSKFKFLDFDKIDSNRVYFFANKYAISKINIHSLNFIIEPVPSMQHSVNGKNKSIWNSYPSYAEYVSLMKAFAKKYPDLCKYHVLGTLSSGKQIIALQLGDSVYKNDNEVRFLYSSSIHGNELTGFPLMLRLIDYLLANYKTNDKVKKLMDNIDIWINPLANPDGAYYYSDTSVWGATRYNANSVDLNRNFPDPEDGNHPDDKKYQQETNIFMSFVDTMNFTMAATLHDGKEVVNYPWDTWEKKHADENWWIKVSKEFADTAQKESPNGYFEMYGKGYTNGYEWYSISGGRQDFMNYFKHCREQNFEISNIKTVADTSLEYYWNYLHKSFLNYMQESLYGFKGRVTDSISGNPIRARLEILNHDKDGSEVFCNDSGYFFRPVYQGSYDLKFTAKGYMSKYYINVDIGADTTKVIDVRLIGGYDGVNTYLENANFKLFPNPTKSNFILQCDSEISMILVYDSKGEVVLERNFLNSNYINVSLKDFSKGIYFVKAVIGNKNITKKIILN